MGCFEMKLLLDSHIWLWWVNQSNDLSEAHKQIIEEAEEVFVSAISCWEITLLAQRQRIQLPTDKEHWFHLALEQSGITCLPLTQAIAIQSALLPYAHRDPADRFIIATSLQYSVASDEF